MDLMSKAKKEKLKELSKMMRDEMGSPLAEKMKGMQKVTVASDSKEGLKKGLSMAEELMEKRKMEKPDTESEEMEGMEEESEEMEESSEEEMPEDSEESDDMGLDSMSMEELKEELMKLKKMNMSGK